MSPEKNSIWDNNLVLKIWSGLFSKVIKFWFFILNEVLIPLLEFLTSWFSLTKMQGPDSRVLNTSVYCTGGPCVELLLGRWIFARAKII